MVLEGSVWAVCGYMTLPSVRRLLPGYQYVTTRTGVLGLDTGIGLVLPLIWVLVYPSVGPPSRDVSTFWVSGHWAVRVHDSAVGTTVRGGHPSVRMITGEWCHGHCVCGIRGSSRSGVALIGTS